MKRALLWLGPLACLALACLYAYAWFNRDPLPDAFDRIHVGMTLEQAIAIVDRPPYRGPKRIVYHGGAIDDPPSFGTVWVGDDYILQIVSVDNQVTRKGLDRSSETFTEKICKWVRNPTTFSTRRDIDLKTSD